MRFRTKGEGHNAESTHKAPMESLLSFCWVPLSPSLLAAVENSPESITHHITSASGAWAGTPHWLSFGLLLSGARDPKCFFPNFIPSKQISVLGEKVIDKIKIPAFSVHTLFQSGITDRLMYKHFNF